MPTLHRRTLLGIAGSWALSAPAWSQVPDELRIGAPLPLTGPLAPEGRKQRRGYDLWAKQVAATGGLDVGGRRLPVRIIYSDYQSATPRAVQAAEQLVTGEKVHALFGPFGSGAAKAASTIAERYRVPMVAPSASSREVYDQGYKYLFGTFTPNETLTEPLAGLVAAAVPQAKRVAVLARNDLLPLALAAEARRSATSRGMQVVYDEKFAIGAMDFASPLTAMRAQAPDWVFVGGYVNDLIQVRTQMRDLGLKPQVLTMIAGPAYAEFTKALRGAAENVSSAAWWHPAVRYAGEDVFGSTERFNALFKAAYDNDEPDYVEASAAAAGAVVQLAATRAGTVAGPALRDALESLDVRTFFGPVRFGANGQIEGLTPPVFQIQDGKAAVLLPGEISQATLRVGLA